MKRETRWWPFQLLTFWDNPSTFDSMPCLAWSHDMVFLHPLSLTAYPEMTLDHWHRTRSAYHAVVDSDCESAHRTPKMVAGIVDSRRLKVLFLFRWSQNSNNNKQTMERSWYSWWCFPTLRWHGRAGSFRFPSPSKVLSCQLLNSRQVSNLFAMPCCSCAHRELKFFQVSRQEEACLEFAPILSGSCNGLESWLR